MKTRKILSFNCHARYFESFSMTGHKLFLLPAGPGSNEWDRKTCSKPSNVTLVKSVPRNVKFDLVIVHDRFNSYQRGKEIADRLGIPFIWVEHQVPYWKHPGLNTTLENDEVATRKVIKEDTSSARVFITQSNKQLWHDDGNGVVIRHGLDKKYWNKHNPVTRKVLTVCNLLRERSHWYDFDLWKKVVSHFPFQLVGENGDLSGPAPNKAKLRQAYRTNACYLSVAVRSPIPMSVVEATMTGMPLVALPTCEIPLIWKDGESALFGHNAAELRDAVRECLSKRKKAKELAKAGQEAAKEAFQMERFMESWNTLIHEVCS